VPDARIADLPAGKLVPALHPYGEWSAQHTTSAAATLAELVRYLNHATIDHPYEAVPDPNTAAAVLGALHTTCTRLPQLLDQLRLHMRVFAQDPNLASSTGNARDLAEQVMQALTEADSASRQLTMVLGMAQQAADRLYLDVADEDV
jgi:homoserine kinase